MRRRPISFDEKIDARYVRLSEAECWIWQGSLHEGVPAINLRHVMRYIYERTFGPIPPGMTLRRRDHRPDCNPTKHACIHLRCVNPHHVIPAPGGRGLYRRAVSWDNTSSEVAAEYKRRWRNSRKG